MTCKIACAFALLFGALPLSALAQQQSGTPKPTKADVQKAAQIISTDKAKLATFCKLSTLDEQMAKADEAGDTKKADEAGDTKKLDELGHQANDLQNELGPDYLKLTAGLDQVDPRSQEGQDLLAPFEALDKTCPK
jgi:hypothetical protein